MSSSQPAPHRWKFARIGGLDQVVLENADDLLNLDQLDQELWVALSCPVKSLEYDEETFRLLDTDGDGRIRVNELLAAIKWLAPRLTDLGAVLKPQEQLPLELINPATPEGAALLASASLLAGGKTSGAGLSVSSITEARKKFFDSVFNGDGIITTEAASTPALKQLVEDVIATQGSVNDLSGKPGITQEKIDAFYESAAAHMARVAAAASTPDILVFGKATPAAFAALKTVREKIDDYFERCRLGAFDARILPALNRNEADYAEIISRDLKVGAAELAAFPIAKITPGKPLSLVSGINPAWSAAVEAFLLNTVMPAYGAGKTELTAAEWASLKAKLAAYETWFSANITSVIAALGDERIARVHATAADDRAALSKLIAQDKALEQETLAMNDINRLVRYYSHLRTLLHNFVNFADFYAPDRAAIFQAGVLYLDSRSCELCIRVDDPAAHSVLGALSRACIAYCDLRRPGEAPIKIAACFTQGDSDYLMVGRNGVFYDTKGRDWDATITKLVVNPISIREAFWSPYKKLIRAIEDQLTKRGQAAEAAVGGKLDATAANVANADKAAPAQPAKKMDVGTVAAIGVAVGAISGALAALATGVMKLAPWQIMLLPFVFLLLVSGPSMFIAWLKLRQRTLGPILDAAGWAINGRVKINIPLGTSLTGIATLPSGARRTLSDPYEDKAAKSRKRRTIFWILFVVVAVAGTWLLWDYRHMQSWFWERL